MKRKVLFVASIDKHIIRFHIPSLKWFHNQGFEIHVACNGLTDIPYCEKIHQVDFVRTPFSFKHLKAYFQIRELLEKEKFNVVHCHTAVSSFITRVAARAFRIRDGLKVIYTTHGFHFFKGSPWVNWLLFYPLEKLASSFNDCLITINSEDFNIAKNSFHCKDVRLVSGMGVDKSNFGVIHLNEKKALRKKWEIPEDAIVIIYVAEFIKRKNHVFILNVAKELQMNFPNVLFLLPGRGILLERMKNLSSKLGLDSIISFPGFIEEISDYIKTADMCISSSKQEGLGLHIIEAMMTALPVIATDVSGHREIISDGVNGFLYPVNDKSKFLVVIEKLLSDPALFKCISENGWKRSQDFELNIANRELFEIYDDLLSIKD